MQQQSAEVVTVVSEQPQAIETEETVIPEEDVAEPTN